MFKYIQQLEIDNDTQFQQNISLCSNRVNIVYNNIYIKDDVKQVVIINHTSQLLRTLHINIMPDVPVSQLVPVYPAAHLHVYLFTVSMHVPLFSQGLLMHSIISTKQEYFNFTILRLYVVHIHIHVANVIL